MEQPVDPKDAGGPDRQARVVALRWLQDLVAKILMRFESGERRGGE